MDFHLKELCMAVLTERIGGEYFTHLLFETKVRLDGYEWDVATKILEKMDEMKSSLGYSSHTIH